MAGTKRHRHRYTRTSVLLVLAILLTSCGFAAPSVSLDGTPSTTSSPSATSGDVVGVPRPLRNVPDSISAVADGKLIVYRMPGIKGDDINATAMLFVPKGSPPPGGWPLMVWGHGTTGWAPDCAPSVQLEEHDTWADDSSDVLFASVLKMGVAIVAPDYEGLGPVADGVKVGHGYYDLSSLGYSMVYAAVAAQRALDGTLSGQWAPTGWSEGGFAALAAAYFSDLAAKADPHLDYRGTIALAPVPDVPAAQRIVWQDIRNSSRTGLPPTDHQINQLVFANAESIYFVKTQRLAGYDVDPSQIYGPNMLKFYQNNWQTCIDDLNALVKQDIQKYLAASPTHTLANYPGIRGDEVNLLPEFRRFYTDNQGKLENSKLPGPILWEFGTADITSPDSVTYNTVNKMLINGNDINLAVLQDASHYDVPTVGLPLTDARLRQLFMKSRLPSGHRPDRHGTGQTAGVSP